MAERHSLGPLPAAPSGSWVYGVVRADDPIRLTGLTGVTGEPVRFVAAHGLVAVVGSVELTGFDDGGAVADLELLERIARAHHRVLTELTRAGALVPFRLGTVYHHDERVAEVVAEHHTRLLEALRLAAGRTEWGLKVQIDLDLFAAALPDPAELAARTGGAGTAYLMRRRVDRENTERLRQSLGDYADDTHRGLAAFAAVSRRFPVSDGRPGERPGPWVALNASYLVPDDRTEEFAAAVQRRRDPGRGIELELTGPWPPYSVCFVNGWEPQWNR